VAVGAQRHQVARIVVSPVAVYVIDIKLACMNGNEAALLAANLAIPSPRSLAQVIDLVPCGLGRN
jgi:hypothetical protein